MSTVRRRRKGKGRREGRIVAVFTGEVLKEKRTQVR